LRNAPRSSGTQRDIIYIEVFLNCEVLRENANGEDEEDDEWDLREHHGDRDLWNWRNSFCLRWLIDEKMKMLSFPKSELMEIVDRGREMEAHKINNGPVGTFPF